PPRGPPGRRPPRRAPSTIPAGADLGRFLRPRRHRRTTSRSATSSPRHSVGPDRAVSLTASIIPSAGLDGPDCFDAPLPDGHAGAVQVHRRTAMSGKYFEAAADADVGIGRFDAGVFLGELGHAVLRPALDRGRAKIL